MRKLFTLILVCILALSAIPAFAESDGLTIGVLYKQSGNPFFDGCVTGWGKAAEEFGFTFMHDGPANGTPEGQIEIIEGYIAAGVDVIAVSANDDTALVSVLQTAMDQGILVVTWDSKVLAEGRNFAVELATAEYVGSLLAECLVKELGDEGGKFAILSAASTAANQNSWIAALKDILASDPAYAKYELITIVYGDDETDKSYQETMGLLDSYPEMKAIVAPTSVGVAAAAACVQDAGKAGEVKVIGTGMPSELADFIREGVMDGSYLCNPINVGYVAGATCVALVNGEFTGAVGETVNVGANGTREVVDLGDGGNAIFVGDYTYIDKTNIDEWEKIV